MKYWGDIPKCNPHFLPESKENKTYINFKNNRKYIYSYEKDDESNIEISDAESNLHLDTNSFANIPILGEVAAGLPTVVNQEYEKHLSLPEDWIFSQKTPSFLK